MDDKDLERTQLIGVIGTLVLAALIVALALPGAPGEVQAANVAAPVPAATR